MRRRRSARFCFDEKQQWQRRAATTDASFIEQGARVRFRAMLLRGKGKAEPLKAHEVFDHGAPNYLEQIMKATSGRSVNVFGTGRARESRKGSQDPCLARPRRGHRQPRQG